MEKNEEQGEYFGICHTCKEKVTGAGQACQAMGNLYHTNCFICCSCGRALRGKAFYNVHGRVYCEEDYLVGQGNFRSSKFWFILIQQYSGFQQTAEKCNICGHLIMEMVRKFIESRDSARYSWENLCRSCTLWESRITLVASVAAYAMNVSMVFRSLSTSTTKFTVSTIIIISSHRSALGARRVRVVQSSQLIEWLNLLSLSGITPVQNPDANTEETVRVVSMDKDFHVDCYVCESCNMQLTDEPDKRCYPLDGHLLCRNCHLQQINSHNRMLEPAPVSYQFLG